MKRIYALLITSLFLVVNGYANELSCNDYCGGSSSGFYNPCCNNYCCCTFDIAGEWLYMLSSIDQPYYAIKEGTGASLFNGDRVANKQRWHSGYRLDFAYYLPYCDYLRVRWTRFSRIINSDSLDEPNFAILVFPITTTTGNSLATVRDRFNFHYLDVVYGKTVYCNCCFSIGIEGGIQYAKLQMKERATYAVSTPITTTFHSNFNSIGPEMAFWLDYSFGGCFSIVARNAASLLVAKKNAHFTHEGLVGEVGLGLVASTKNDDYYVGAPMVNIRLGLNYNTMLDFLTCFCGRFGLDIEVGYEFIHLFKGADRIYFVDDAAEGQSFTEQMDWTLHGPYVRLGICF